MKLIKKYSETLDPPGIYYLYAQVDGLPDKRNVQNQLTLLVDGEAVARAGGRTNLFVSCVWRVKQGEIDLLVYSSRDVRADDLNVRWNVSLVEQEGMA